MKGAKNVGYGLGINQEILAEALAGGVLHGL
jgi:hypothetical protein